MAGRRFLDFHKKNYRNPFFRRSKRGFHFFKKSRKEKLYLWRRRVVLFFILITAVGWVWLFFYSPYFKIEKIEILGLEQIDKNEIKAIVDSQLFNRRFLIFRQSNIFIFDEKSLSKNINAKYFLNNLAINKDLPSTLIIQIKEKTSKLIWVTNNKNYYLDLSGTVIGEVAALPTAETEGVSSAKNLPIIYDESNKEVNIGEKVLEESRVLAVIELTERILQFTGVEIDFYKLINGIELRAITKEGWYILFADDNIENQLKKLDLILKEKIKEKRKNLEYIDLRFEDRVYYK